ncbi:small ubiquitin-related modifier-like [Nesidiocoris tenuis]|uniref:Small ubiquitin-related modifier n=1 Tax=Nesidiocoris tenuis TaxID=355587 RepID=A0ABN7AYP0_9HEMI|nr:small ubiquitin-related modifier-like [Nesidiocoris tenuis]
MSDSKNEKSDGNESEGEAQEETQSTKPKDETEYIKLKVVGNNANEIHFKVKMTTQMGKLKKSYSQRMGISVTSLRFLFDGRRISDEDSPKQLGMVDDDMIEVYQEQTGGSASLS